MGHPKEHSQNPGSFIDVYLYQIINIPLSHEYGHIACSHIWEEQPPQGVLSSEVLFQDRSQHPPNRQPVGWTSNNF